MTAVCPAHKARDVRLTEHVTTITRPIKVSSKIRYDRKQLVPVAEMHEEHDDGSVSSRPQEFAGGFVDFLLGRGARYRR